MHHRSILILAQALLLLTTLTGCPVEDTDDDSGKTTSDPTDADSTSTASTTDT